MEISEWTREFNRPSLLLHGKGLTKYIQSAQLLHIALAGWIYWIETGQRQDGRVHHMYIIHG
jgi:hypothetical protein